MIACNYGGCYKKLVIKQLDKNKYLNYARLKKKHLFILVQIKHACVKIICLNNKDKCMIISTRLLSKYVILY